MAPFDRAKRLRTLARRWRIDAIGFAPASSFLPCDVNVTSIGYHLNHGPVQDLPKSRSAYMLEHDYANRHLAECAQRLVRRLEAEGCEAAGFDVGAGFYRRLADSPHGLAGDFPQTRRVRLRSRQLRRQQPDSHGQRGAADRVHLDPDER